MTYGMAQREAADNLKKCGVRDAETDAWYLMEHCCHMTKARYLLIRGEEMPQDVLEAYRRLVARRGERIPLQHITGEQEFMGISFRVTPDVLIPRQDTEVLVETALGMVNSASKERLILQCSSNGEKRDLHQMQLDDHQMKPVLRVLDLCTGSGCIAISLKKLEPSLEVTGTDRSEAALKVARENAQRAGAEVTFLCSDLFENLHGTWDMIVSNPPYIPSEDISSLDEEVALHDPLMALDGGADGLYFYRKIIKESPGFLRESGILAFEIGYDQGQAVSEFMKHCGFRDVCVRKDLAGKDRVAIGVNSNLDKRSKTSMKR